MLLPADFVPPPLIGVTGFARHPSDLSECGEGADDSRIALTVLSLLLVLLLLEVFSTKVPRTCSGTRAVLLEGMAAAGTSV